MMIKDLAKKLVTSRVGQLVLAFVAGGVITGVFLPEKITVKKETVVEYKDKIVEKEVVKYVDREVIKEITVVEKVKVVKRKETFPDGHIIEEEVFESESEQVARIAEQEKERYTLLLTEKEKEYAKKESYLKETLNPHKFHIFAGAMTQADDPKNYGYLGGMDAQVWGPLTLGMQATSRKDVAVTVGFRF